MKCESCRRRTDDVTNGLCWRCHYFKVWYAKAIDYTIPIHQPGDRTT